MNPTEEFLPHKRMKYRPDIDGLRAVAVLIVFAFHMNKAGFSGGFVGVDVFFVISGYLISYIVFSEIAESRFSITGFYERRIRRIFPALFGMLVAFTLFAAIYLLPNELSGYGESLLATTLSASNFYFLQHSIYFDAPTLYPLLHTWSLGVEEQFYIVFPIVLVIARRLFPHRLRTTVVVLFLLSLAASAWVVTRSPVTAFYMLYTRAWELLMGTLLSLGIFPRIKNLVIRNLAAVAGIGLIAYACLVFTGNTPFPGLSALIPVVGSALIIGVGESGTTLVGAVLSWRPVVFIGLISYSLYLWHWPVIVVQHLQVLGKMEHGTVAISSFLLAVFSWAFIERPFRSGQLRMSGRPLFVAAASVMAVFVAISGYLVLSGGIHGRFTPEAQEIGSYVNRTDLQRELMRYSTCFLESDISFDHYKQEVCLHRDPVKTKSYLLIGDSHAAMLWNALADSIPDANILQATATPCKPFIHPTGSETCVKMMNFIYQNYLPANPVQGLFISIRSREVDRNGMAETIAWAKNHNLPVMVFGNVPEYDEALPRLLAYTVGWHDPQLPAEHRVSYSASLDAELQKLAAEEWHVPYISLYQEICQKGTCLEFADDAHRVPLMLDGDHFSREGALVIVRKLIRDGKLS